jgi:hypothetical protein
MLRRMFGPKRDEARETGENYIKGSSIIFVIDGRTVQEVLARWSM